jgi:hypothetical protein
MSERERWVVYPLLFLALGAALRDKLFDRTTTKSIVCQELTVIDEVPVGGQPARILAKIGRSESATGGPPSGYLFVNGQFEVVAEATDGQRFVTVPLARIGRLAPSPGGTTNGYLMVSGQLEVNRINARQYAYQGVPFVPALQAMFTPPGSLMKALQQSIQAQQSKAAQKTRPPQTAEAGPAAEEAKNTDDAEPGKRSDAESSDTPTRTEAQPPLADPNGNR